MKILYGIQATGNGHISRGRVMAKYLAQSQIDVTYLFSGREQHNLFEMEAFGEYIHRKGLTFATVNGQINHLKTFKDNSLIDFIKDVKSLNVDAYDLIITDFEPITAWAAKRAKKPSLAIGHQYAFDKNTPLAGESFIAKAIMRYFAPAQEKIGLHWAKYDAHVLPPIIDNSLVKQPKNNAHNAILVYLPFENQQEVCDLLNRFPLYNFIQYSSELTEQQQGNVTQKRASLVGFKNDLCQSSGVICNSGFELNSECLHLGLPILTKPIKGQMEQESNALALASLGLGQVMLYLDESIIEQWLLTQHQVTKKEMPDVAKAIVNWLVDTPRSPVSELANHLWV
ncbi:MJ1255/VC2487 family glycosyltransferase [Thalassotalea profundi]|uniref:Glycosyl transferase n=1 Tax=Thalassotalea profundi TaxID=2036687 RepID=A0ABQ3IHP5_9GAMM|nr:MJ1255/VC2487 family glycosyltransferase [Thalassotalea profundi]GHE84915.1 glycosyl transferase [Thalassotalea profundi]